MVENQGSGSVETVVSKRKENVHEPVPIINDSCVVPMIDSQTSADKKSPKKSPKNFEEAYAFDNFFAFRRFLRKTKVTDFVPSDAKRSKNCFQLRKSETLFEKLPGENVNLFEKILASCEAKSAKYICLIWEEYKFWNNENILICKGDASEKLPIEFVMQSDKAQNFFSFLVFDWHNPDEHVATDGKKYYLELKNKQMIEKSSLSLFQKLYEIIDGKAYHDVCLRIIYEYLAEMKKPKDFSEVKKLVSIETLLKMKNKKYQSKILEILVTYWNILWDDDEFKEQKDLQRITKEEGGTFFQLAFHLIERNFNQFESGFEQFVKDSKQQYGHYDEAIIKPIARLFLKIAKSQKMSQVESFIFHKCHYLEINSTPLTNFEDFYKFNNKNIFPFNHQELKILEQMETAFIALQNIDEKFSASSTYKNQQLEAFRNSYKLTAHRDKGNASSCGGYATARNLLFEHHGRQDEPQESLFEKILSTPGMASLIHVIWDEFELWRKEKVLKTVNPSEKLLIHYVIRSKDDMNLIAFMMPSVSSSESLVSKKYFLKMQSEQYFQQENKSIFERYLHITDNHTRDSFFNLCLYLLEEMDFIVDIKNQTCVEKVLSKGNFVSHIFRNIINAPADVGDLNGFNSDQDSDDEKYEHKYDCDKLLKYFATYWTTVDKNYETYKQKLIDHSPFFKMMANILEGNEDAFIKNFHEDLNRLIVSYNKRYAKIEKNELMMLDDLFILFRASIKNEKKRIMECILDYESFETLEFKFPRYKKANQINHHTALKLLQHGYNLGQQRVPDDWISEPVMTEFLDLQIKILDQDMVQMNTNVLLCTFDRQYKIKTKNDVDNQMLFRDYTNSLEFIVQNEALKDLVLHPLLSTYINLKSYKYQKLYEINFVLFFFMYMLPFGFLITHHSLDGFNGIVSSYFVSCLQILCTTSTSLMTIRELVQMTWITKSLSAYFKSRSNQIEILMIILSWALLLAISYLNVDEHMESFSFVSTLFITTSTIVLLTMLPFKSMPLYMMMLKRVSITFLRFFTFFFFILLAFSISFCVIFRPKNVADNSEDDGEDVYKNFDTWFGSFFKTVLMLSGEYTIEPFTLSPTKMIIFFVFVLTSFVLFNLILGLAIDEVQCLKKEAEILILRYEAKKFIETAGKWKEIYDQFGLEDNKIDAFVWWKRYLAKVMRILIINYCFIHKIGKIYVNMKTKEVSFEINRKHEAALTQYSGKAKKYFMEQEVFDRLKTILKERSETEFKESKVESIEPKLGS